MEYEDAEIEQVTDADAFRRKWKHTSKHKAGRFLPDDIEYDVMRLCVSAAGDVTKGAEWYTDLPLAQVYKWLAVRLAEISEE